MSARDVQVRVFKPDGTPVGTVWPVKGVNMAWVENGPAGATFTTPKTGMRWDDLYMGELNRVEIHHENLPYVWTGVILQPVPNGPDVNVACMSLEWLFTKRFTEEWFQSIGTGGVIARDLYNQAIRTGRLDAGLGALDTGGTEYYQLYELKRVSEALSELATLVGGQWWIEKRGHTHVEQAVFRFARKRGRDLSGSVLLSSEIVDTPDYQRTAEPMATALYVLGGGIGSSLSERIWFYRPNKDAKRRYNLLEEVVEYPDVIDLALLDKLTNTELERRGKPTKTLGLNIDNRRDTWGRFWMGDTVRAFLSGVEKAGLDALVKIRGIQVDVDNEKMGLVVDIVR